MKFDIITANNSVINACLFSSQAPSMKNFLIVSSAPYFSAEVYDEFATHLAKMGITVLTFEYRIHSKPSRRISDRLLFSSLANDLDEVIQWSVQHYPDHAISVIGHGAGASIIALTKHCGVVANIINVGGRVRSIADFTTGDMLRFMSNAVGKKINRIVKQNRRIITKTNLDPKYLRTSAARIRRASPDISQSQLKKAIGGLAFRGRFLTVRLHDDIYKYPEQGDVVVSCFPNASSVSMRNLFHEDIEADYIGFFGLFRPHNNNNTLWEMLYHWITDKVVSKDYEYANFDDTYFPIVRITISSRDPTEEMVRRYFELMHFHLSKGPVYLLIDLSLVNWADNTMAKKANLWIESNIELIKKMHLGTVYIAPNFFIRNFLIGFHLLQFVSVIKPIKVFKTFDLASNWLNQQIKNKHW